MKMIWLHMEFVLIFITGPSRAVPSQANGSAQTANLNHLSKADNRHKRVYCPNIYCGSRAESTASASALNEPVLLLFASFLA